MLWRVLLDSRAQPLMLDKAAVRALGLQQGALRTYPFTFNTSMEGSKKAIGITVFEGFILTMISRIITNLIRLLGRW